jgi:hypothetical protein
MDSVKKAIFCRTLNRRLDVGGEMEEETST